jgi:phenylalanyl-tRNA synthetase beta chain
MKISYRWLQDYVKVTMPPEKLGERFLMTSSELEGLEDWGSKLEGLVVGKVLSIAKHPNADRLRVAEVDIGTKKVIIVCGSPFLAEAQHVVVALPGATLHPVKGESFVMKEMELRGVHSGGMICALEEIGIPIPSESIFIFDTPVKPGTPAAEALELDDTVLDLEITPNRPDLLSYVGLAREAAAFDKKRLIDPPILFSDAHQRRVNRLIDILRCPPTPGQPFNRH